MSAIKLFMTFTLFLILHEVIIGFDYMTYILGIILILTGYLSVENYYIALIKNENSNSQKISIYAKM